jgi:hypothetical protein
MQTPRIWAMHVHRTRTVYGFVFKNLLVCARTTYSVSKSFSTIQKRYENVEIAN